MLRPFFVFFVFVACSWCLEIDKPKRDTTRDHPGPISQTYGPLPHPNRYIFEKPFPRLFRKGTIHPPSGTPCSVKSTDTVRHAKTGLKSITTGSKWAKTTCLSIPNGPGSLLEKRVFDPFSTHFWSQNNPFSRHFGIFRGPKHATTCSKRPKNTCLSIPSGLGTTLEKIFFFAPGTPVDPPLAPTVRGLPNPPAPPSDHWYGGLRVSLGDSEAWKPQKVGGCGWTRCPRNSFLSHVAQDTARSWFRGAGAHCAVFGAFWRLFGPFLGHIVELERTKGPLVTRKSSRTWSVAAVCLRLAVLHPY